MSTRICKRCEQEVHIENFYMKRNVCNFCLAEDAKSRRQAPMSEISRLLSGWQRPPEVEQ